MEIKTFRNCVYICNNKVYEFSFQTGRALSADVAQLGDERLAKLEQALALCLEIDQSFGELHSWLESMENEIENCPPVTIGHQRDQLMQQQVHNSVNFLILLSRILYSVETAHIYR